MTDSLNKTLKDALEAPRMQFVDLWGQMAQHWGINRTMAKVHALLMVAPRPLTAEDIMETLQISRGNASMNLRELINWGIVRRTSIAGDRRDFFTSEEDVWVMLQNIMRERKRRELDPLLDRISKCIEAADKTPVPPEDAAAHTAYVDKMAELLQFFTVFHKILGKAIDQQPAFLSRLTKMVDKMI